jgi:hypothetical protein
MRLLQAPLAAEQPAWLAGLAGAIDGLVAAIGVAAEAGEKEEKRALQRQLEAVVLSGSTNLPLLQALLPALAPESGYRLPSLLPPAACLVLVKGVLLLGDGAIASLDRPVRRALLALLERGLPRMWWQADLLQKLLHDLRRFPLHAAWLQADNATLLPALVTLHSRGVAPPPPDHGPEPLQLRPLAPEELPGEPEDPRRLLRLQLTVLLRLVSDPEERGALLRLASGAGEALAIHDDDDLSHPLRLELQWLALQQGAVAVYGRHVRLDEATAAPQADGDGGGFFGDGITTLLLRRRTALELGGFYPVRSRGDVDFRRRLEQRYGAAKVVRLEAPLYLMRSATTTVSSAFEYGCSLGLPSWRRLMRLGLLP